MTIDTEELRTDFDDLEEGAKIILHPFAMNPLHKNPVRATYGSGYFYCEGSDASDGPDYYLGDVRTYCRGFTLDGEKPHGA